MKTRIKLLLFTLALSSVSFGQIKIKTPDLEKKAKEKLEKSKDKKEKDVKEKKEKKIEEVEKDKKPSTTTASEKVEEKKSEELVSNYPKVNEPTIFFSKDPEYKQPVTELTPGEGDFYMHVVLPTKNVNDYLVNSLSINNGEIYGELKISFFDEYGNPVKLEGLVRDKDDRLVTFTINQSKKMNGIVIPILKALEGTVQKQFASRISKKGQQAGIKSGINKINIEYSIDNSTASSQQVLANPKKVISSSFNMNVIDANRAKAKKYAFEARDIEKVEIPAPAGQVHATNLGKIVFSKKPILTNSDDVSALSSTFKLTDDIFGAICLSDCYRNMLAEYGGSRLCYNGVKDVRIFIIVDGKEYINMPISSSLGCQRTFANLTLIDKSDQSKDISDNIYGGKALAYILSQLPAGKHNVKFEMRVAKSIWENLDESRPLLMASGEMTLEFTITERDSYVKTNGQTFEFTSNITKDASITSLAKKEIPGAINYKVSDMIVQRNLYDKITHREGYMNAIVKDENGDYELRTYKTTQQFVGGKWANKMTVNYLNSYFYFVPVQNHK